MAGQAADGGLDDQALRRRRGRSPAGAPWRGCGRALEILLTGRPVDASLARQLGLFTETSSDPLGAALDLAATFARRPPGAVRATKRLLREVATGTLDAAIDREAHVRAAAVHGAEFARHLDPWRTSRRPD